MLQHEIEELFEDIHPNWKKRLVEDSDPCIVDLTDLIPTELRFVAINTLHNKRTVVFERLKRVRECVLEAERMVNVMREAKCGVNVIREAEYELEAMRRAEGEVTTLNNTRLRLASYYSSVQTNNIKSDGVTRQTRFVVLLFFPFVLFHPLKYPSQDVVIRTITPQPRGSKTCLLMQTLAFGSLRSPKGKTIPLTFPLSSFLKVATVTSHDLYWRGQKTYKIRDRENS